MNRESLSGTSLQSSDDNVDFDYGDYVGDLHCSFNGNSSDLVEPQFKSPGQGGSHKVPAFFSLYRANDR